MTPFRSARIAAGFDTIQEACDATGTKYQTWQSWEFSTDRKKYRPAPSVAWAYLELRRKTR